ncbi:MAG TPA: SIS domain-containing protein [Ktedonosporobacter sp.]|nr:SIS domain-containing protein [Ktedonosporobacter sp.]
MATEPRTTHPFHMYDAITIQPQTFVDIVERVRPIAEQMAPTLAAARQIFLVGIGTSFHAVQLGQYFLYHYGVTVPIQAVHSFDFALYGPALSPNDCVIVVSHRGAKQYSLASLKRASEAGCYTLLITGQSAPDTAYASATLRTTPPERSSAFTFSYTAALAALATLAEATGYRLTGNEPHPRSFLSQELPDALRASLQTETQIASLAAAHLGHRRIWLVGGGPSGVTAQEAALKIKETSYRQAEGMSTEAILHGPFQCVEPEDLFILIAPSGPAQERILSLAAMIKEIGTPYLVIDDGTATSIQQDAAGHCTVPALPEPFAALTSLLPLQLFSYHLALNVGTNPDGFRLEDPRFAAAFKHIKL